MPVQQTISLRDLELLAEISDPSRLREPGDPLPISVLHDLLELVPCDCAGFAAYDPHTHASHGSQEGHAEGVPDTYDTDECATIYWENFWTWPASHPERTGDYTTIIRNADFSMSRRAAATSAEFLRLGERRHALVVPLTPCGPVSHRVILWRDDGINFSDRDVLLMKLLRPHLVQMRDLGFRRRDHAGELTARQYELLRMVAGGQTNRQIARHLHIAEGTVRKHLENIYARLGASNRTSAVELAMPSFG
jgi:DNA-binding CsgD family transcriptional regulator